VKLGRGAPMTFEHSMLRTATLCLVAFGAVMVYSASSGTTLLTEGGDSSYYLKRYLASAALGMIVLTCLSRWGMGATKRLAPILLAASFAGLVLVLVPGFGLEVNGARRWLGAGSLQVQPSELAKLALVLYAAGLIAVSPGRARSLGGMRPLLLVAGAMAGLVLLEPDLGTAIVICLTVGALLVVSGVKIRTLLMLGGALALLALFFSLTEPYRRERLISFLDPWADSDGAGFQSVQAMIAIGSGGPLGVGLGESVQKLFYLPEAHTDMILAVIGEELGLAGILAVLFLYGMIAYAGLRAARRARDLYSKLVAAGITAVILIQATVNFFAALGVLPVTGVPLPFISYGNSSLIVLMAAMGLLINVAQQGGATAARGSEESGNRNRGLRLLDGGGAGAKRSERATTVRSRRKAAGPPAATSRAATGRAPKQRAAGTRAASRPAAKRRAAKPWAAKPWSAKRRAAKPRAATPRAAIRKLVDGEDRDRSRRDRRTRGAGAGDRRRAAR
jgi:cell division protein FtsW